MNLELRRIHLAKLPELRYFRTRRLSIRTARCVLAAIVIHTDNGRRPQRMKALGETVGLTEDNFESYLAALAIAGFVTLGVKRSSRGVGFVPCRSVTVNFAKLAEIGEVPLCEREEIKSLGLPGPAAADRVARADLIEIRDAALRAVGVGLATIGRMPRQISHESRRQRAGQRAMVVQAMLRIAKAKKVELRQNVIARLLGIQSQSVACSVGRHAGSTVAPKSQEVA